MKGKLKSISLDNPQDRNEEIIKFLTHDMHGRNPLPVAAESWKWRYIDAPAGEGIISIVVDTTDKERILGHSALGIFRCRCEGNDISVGVSAAVFVNPDYRKLGAYAILRKTEDEAARRRGLSMLIGFPSRIATSGFLLTGFRMQQQFEVALRAITFMQRGALKKPVSFIKHAGLYTLGRLAKHNLKFRNVDVKQLKSFGTETDILWKRVWNNYSGIIKDSRYLNWRYKQRPNTSFIALMGLKKDKPRVLCIIEWHNDQPRTGWLAELITRYDDEDDAIAVLNEAERQAVKEGIEKLTALIDGVSITGAVVNKWGYYRYHTRAFMIRVFDKQLNGKLSSPWRYSMGDFMTGMRMI